MAGPCASRATPAGRRQACVWSGGFLHAVSSNAAISNSPIIRDMISIISRHAVGAGLILRYAKAATHSLCVPHVSRPLANARPAPPRRRTTTSKPAVRKAHKRPYERLQHHLAVRAVPRTRRSRRSGEVPCVHNECVAKEADAPQLEHHLARRVDEGPLPWRLERVVPVRRRAKLWRGLRYMRRRDAGAMMSIRCEP